MALRRALSFSTTVLTHRHHHFKTLAAATTTTLFSLFTTTTSPRHIPRRFFQSTTSLSRQFNDFDKLDPDDILFEGCDYKHWLIVMDFPHDPQQRPPPHEMIETYVQTLASVVGSVEEAKKRMYACSTTTYTGFQAEMDEETSKKFEGLSGVLFVLPDSYIDPENKEYGGDKYVNGTIIPRPPPVQYGRVRRSNRQNDQSPRGQEKNPYYNQNLSSDGREYAPQQRSPRQSFPPQQGPPQQQGFHQQGFPPQQRAPPQQGFPQQQGVPPQQGFPQQQGVPPQRGFPQQQGVPPQRGFPQQQGVPPQRGFPQQQGAPLQHSYGQAGQGVGENYMNASARDPIGGRNTHPSGGNNYMPSHQGNYNQRHDNPQRQVENLVGDHMGLAQGQTGFSDQSRKYDSPYPGRGPSGQASYGSVNQGETRQYATPPTGGYGEGMQSGYGPGYEPRGENQTHGNTMSTEQSNYSPTGYTGGNQGRH